MESLQIVPAQSNVEAQYVEMRVPLYSYGCGRKLKKALGNIKGIYSVNVDYTQQKVTVWGICNKHDVLATMRRKRKEARFWGSEDSSNIGMEVMKVSEASDATTPPLTKTKRSLSLSWKVWKNIIMIRSHSF